MIATEEKALDKANLNELGKSISNELRSWRNAVVHSPAALSQKDFREIVRWLKAWRERDPQAEGYFTALLTLLLASYVEADIEERFEKVFTDRFLSLLK
ncbi:MAG TPA: hypothetical protein VID27_09580 [Blastocatellia bacterium]|jgi:hypothetical protein